MLGHASPANASASPAMADHYANKGLCHHASVLPVRICNSSMHMLSELKLAAPSLCGALCQTLWSLHVCDPCWQTVMAVTRCRIALSVVQRNKRQHDDNTFIRCIGDTKIHCRRDVVLSKHPVCSMSLCQMRLNWVRRSCWCWQRKMEDCVAGRCSTHTCP